MTPDELAQQIRSKGFQARSDGRAVTIAEKEFEFGWRGIAFVVIAEADEWLIECFSARLYRCELDRDILGLCLDMLSGDYVPSGKTPPALPQSLLEKYSARGVNC